MYVEYLRIVVLSETELIEVTDVKIWQTDNTDMYNVYCTKYYNWLYRKYSTRKTSTLNCVTILLQPTFIIIRALYTMLSKSSWESLIMRHSI